MDATTADLLQRGQTVLAAFIFSLAFASPGSHVFELG